LIIVDTVNRTLAGSESKDQDVARYLAARALVEDEFKCCVVLIHHCGIEAGRPRGHTSLTAAADVQIAIVRDAAQNVVAAIELAKDGPSGEQFISQLETVDVGQNQHGEKAMTCIIVPVDGPSVTKTTRPWSTQTELARRALANAIADQGEKNPVIPAGQRGVPVRIWREDAPDAVWEARKRPASGRPLSAPRIRSRSVASSANATGGCGWQKN
jgi:hypothetical protein